MELRSSHLDSGSPIPPQPSPQASRSRYSATAAEQILKQAVKDTAETDFSWETMLAMGAELGLSPDVLAAAEQRWQGVQQQEQRRQALRAQRSQQLRQYLGVNTLLVVINILVCGTVSWAIWPILGWGAGLLLPKCSEPHRWL